MNPLVTVYVLVYKNEKELPDTIAGILKQDYRPLEVIISDDGSHSYDTSILESEANRIREMGIPCKVNVNEVNVGTVKHINKVLDLAEGEILIPNSSGDILAEQDTVSKIVKGFGKQKTLALTSLRREVYDDGSVKVKPRKFTGFFLGKYEREFFTYTVTKRAILSGCCTFYTKALFEKHGKFDENYLLTEDYTYLAELLRKGETIGWLPEVTVVHGAGGVSTGKVNPKVYKDIETYRDHLYESRDSLPKKVKRYLEKDHEERHG